MKNLLYSLLFTFTALSCKAQNPIISLFDGNEYLKTENAYYKDTYNDFDRFVGTWKFTDGNEEFTMILKKKVQHQFTYINRTYYEDTMYGEYQYIDENGNELVNTLSNIDNTVTNISEHKIFGSSIIPYKFLPKCEDCLSDERRLELSITDPNREYLNTNIVLRTIPNLTNATINDIELKLTLDYSIIPDGAPTLPRVLEYYTIYRLIKQ
ncbi:hypothetical protein DFR65_1234 [Oceanihabitans sediminis]|uniref:DUF6705 domain-containing protein n=1 Tax=Oceanihabitans sediminis TaxID=1812012 RepID=A0A368P2Q8_9FLAO|nr:DUF6705 family protein [Oceanihabitans sediminis]MDX1774516.1 DUF6705 family protein [Oceanihabitans sediminis]RBP25657.1 hypothetical protein DFR65_1234 [Oceanihabitans sediminis]RCU56703.1 hypothetical protein DU428_12500 [Oceanihabitans sediminis]